MFELNMKIQMARQFENLDGRKRGAEQIVDDSFEKWKPLNF